MSKVLAIRVSLCGRWLKNFAFDQDTIRIGRDPASDICLPSPDVSRIHVQILREAGHFVLMDTGSSNGTTVNKKVVRQVELEHEDTIAIGQFTLFVEVMSKGSEGLFSAAAPAASRNMPTIKRSGSERR